MNIVVTFIEYIYYHCCISFLIEKATMITELQLQTGKTQRKTSTIGKNKVKLFEELLHR